MATTSTSAKKKKVIKPSGKKVKVSNIGKLNSANKPRPRTFYEVKPTKVKTGWIQGTATSKSYYQGSLNQIAHALRYQSDAIRRQVLGNSMSSGMIYRSDFDTGFHEEDDLIAVDEDVTTTEEVTTNQKQSFDTAWESAVTSIVNEEVNEVLDQYHVLNIKTED